MTDEIKTIETDATAAFDHTKEVIGALEADETKAGNWIAIHHVYIYVGIAFVVGLIGGYFLK